MDARFEARMKRGWDDRWTWATIFVVLFLAALTTAQQVPPPKASAQSNSTPAIFGFDRPEAQLAREKQFLAIPDPKRAEQHLKILTAAPHIAGSPEDHETAEYVARQFRAAGLDTRIVEYRVWMNYPAEISVDVTAPPDVHMHGPTREHVEGDDPYQNDPRVLPAFNGGAPSGDVEAEVVYANYGRREDLARLRQSGVETRGKILIERYDGSYRGSKVLIAQENGAAGVIFYSDPAEDGWTQGEEYPRGPWRPATSVQRGSVGFVFEFPGDPTTPGIASTLNLPDSRRTPPKDSAALPKIPATPLSYADAWPILAHLGGRVSPRDWQGAFPFTYHVGPGPVRIRLRLRQDYAYRIIWNVIGTASGREWPDEWVIAGNHRDAWVYGAADPGSGTAALLEAVHGFGELLRSGWRPRRTLIFCSWDAEEQGLLGSTEWVEENLPQLASAVAYFNTDVSVSGPGFSATAVPSLKALVRDVTKAVPSPQGGTVYDAWLAQQRRERLRQHRRPEFTPAIPSSSFSPSSQSELAEPQLDNLGSGSDFAAFLNEAGVPATDIGSSGDYGVYHSVFDNYAWFKRFADPNFLYVQQQARVMGLEVLRMSEADVLPYDFEEYGLELSRFLAEAQTAAQRRFGKNAPSFAGMTAALSSFLDAARATKETQNHPATATRALNVALRQVERQFLLASGLPNRPWMKHAIFAPGRYTGYEPLVLPGIREAVAGGDLTRTRQQIAVVAEAMERASQVLSLGTLNNPNDPEPSSVGNPTPRPPGTPLRQE